MRWYFIILGAMVLVDHLSHLNVLHTNNKAETILNCFLKGVKCYGIPSRVRSEEGMENDFMIEKGEVLVKV